MVLPRRGAHVLGAVAVFMIFSTSLVNAQDLESPVVGESLEDVSLTVGDGALVVDVASGFGGVVDLYEVSSGDEGVVGVSVVGSVVSLTPVAAGSAMVTVSAVNGGGSVSQSFAVTVRPAAPVVLEEILDQEFTIGDGALVVDVASGFGGVVDLYEVSSGDEGVVGVSVVGSVVSLCPESRNLAQV